MAFKILALLTKGCPNKLVLPGIDHSEYHPTVDVGIRVSVATFAAITSSCSVAV